MKKKTLCPHCGASMMEYRHSLSVALITGLTRLTAYPSGVNIKELHLTRNQWDNFQKLRYWDLVSQPDGKQKSGEWYLTRDGWQFIKNILAVPRVVWTYRGQRVRYEEGDQVTVRSMLPGYRYRADYAADAKPHDDDPLLF